MDNFGVRSCKVERISIVGDPAIGLPFIFRGGLLYGPVLVPDIKIVRSYDYPYYGDKFYTITFSKEIIKSARRGFNNNKITFEHSGVVCSFPIVKNEILTNSLSFMGITYPRGSWMVGLNVSDKVLSNLIRGGVLNGFSIEAEIEL